MERVIKILVPIDFSSCSENALLYAMQLANKIKAHIWVLHVPSFDTSNMSNPISASVEVEKQISRSRKRLIQSVQKVTKSTLLSLNETPPIQTNIAMGKIEATISDEAVKNQVDYIVMGTQGENSTIDKYLGSVASNVLKSAPCSVMIIPEKSEFSKKLNIGYAVDLLDAETFEIWKEVKLFKPFQPEIKCIYFNDQQINIEDKVKELEIHFAQTAPELNVKFYSLPVKDKVKDMNDFIVEHDINMLVMYKPKRSFFDSIFHSSYTQKMASHTNIPLLVFKQSK